MEPTPASLGNLDGARVHRALSSPVRTRILRLILGADHVPAEVRSLAAATDLHVNTVRAHLAVLEGAGLVRSEPQARDRPGRPRLAYHATPTAHEVLEPSAVAGVSAERGYRFLAQVLAGHLASNADDPAGEAASAGAAWGRYLVERPAPGQELDADGAVDRLVGLLAEFGFEPEVVRSRDVRSRDLGGEQPQVLLRRCPFHQLAAEQAEVVCSIHLGLMQGALDELGADVAVRDLRPFVQPDLCVTDLEQPQTRPANGASPG